MPKSRRTPPNRCPFTLQVNDRKRIKCRFELYKDHGFCIFHSPLMSLKEEDFPKALSHLLESYSKDKSKVGYEFAGFVFTSSSAAEILAWRTFQKPVYFQSSRFDGEVRFHDCKFM